MVAAGLSRTQVKATDKFTLKKNNLTAAVTKKRTRKKTKVFRTLDLPRNTQNMDVLFFYSAPPRVWFLRRGIFSYVY